MSNDAIFITQLVAILAVVGSNFALYRLLVSQKDAVIELLKERLEAEKAKSEELKGQAPDVLVEALNKRVAALMGELHRMASDGNFKESEVLEKELELKSTRESLAKLSKIIEDSDLVCPACSSPLRQRGSHTIYGHSGGREVEADIEYREYECGAIFQDSEPTHPCGNASKGDKT